MKFQITFDDGTVSEFKVKPRHLVQHEHETKKDGDNLITTSYKLAWMASGSEQPFREWLDTVDEIETLDVPGVEGSADPDGGAETVPTRSRSRA